MKASLRVAHRVVPRLHLWHGLLELDSLYRHLAFEVSILDSLVGSVGHSRFVWTLGLLLLVSHDDERCSPPVSVPPA